MKKILLCTFLLLFSIKILGQDVVAYTKVLPKISKKGVIDMPDGKKLKIENFKDKNTTILVFVRHAEKDSTGTNADLIPVGRGRAEALSKVLQSISFDIIYSTNRARTRNTAEPTAKSQKKAIILYDAKNAVEQTAFLEKLVAMHGQKFFIVGHSNTVPQMMNLLRGLDAEKDIPDLEFSRIYIVSVKKMGEGKILMINY